MRATVIDHVIVHGMTMAEAGLRVRPNLSRFTVATIIGAFRQHNRVERMPHRGGRVAIFTAAQETLIVDMVRYYSWMRWPDLMSTSSWMRLASTCRNEGKEAVTSWAKEPSLRSLGLVHRHAVLGSYNTQRLLTFLEELKDILLDRQQHHPGPAHHIYVIIWDNVRFHRTNQIREWFTTNSDHFLNVCLPPYSPFLNPIEEFFSSWRWKVYDRQPYTRENLLRAMELACVDIPAEAFQGWIRHSRAFFPRCLERDNIACDVDEVMWPDAAQRHDAAQ
ncbi:bestrophin-4 [Sarotherodon galilaeus]